MDSVEWGEFELSHLFEKVKVKTLPFKTSELPKIATNNFTLPALTAGILNQGLNNYVPRINATLLNNVISISANGANTGATFYQNKEFTVLQDAYAIKWKYTDEKLTQNQYIYLTASVSKAIRGNFDWTKKAGWERIKSEKITLPIFKNGEINFYFMESFISELEAERIVELEAERIVELEAYLMATGLNDYILTTEEQTALDIFDTITWDVFKIEEVLNWQQNIIELDPLKLNSLTVSIEKKYPFYGQSTTNNGIIEYRHLKDDVLNNKQGKPTILIHSNNQNTIYLDTPFYLKDGHGATSVLQSKYLNKLTAQFFMGSIKKVILQKYSYNMKATKIELKNTEISLPITANHSPDYDYMTLVTSAIQKLVIKDVVKYAEQKTLAHKQVIKAG